jgi:hypothetical protein
MEFEEIVRYIDGELSNEEALAFEEKLKVDNALNQSYREVLAARKLSSEWIEAEIRGHLNDVKQEQNQTTTSSQNTNKKWLYGLLGILLLTAILYFTQKAKDTNTEKQELEMNQYAMNYEEPVWPIERGESDEISKAISLHLAGKTEEAVKQLKGTGEMSLLKKYWLAEVLMHASRVDEAGIVLQELRKAVTNSNQDVIDVERLAYMEKKFLEER